jgi:hypothetical protein
MHQSIATARRMNEKNIGGIRYQLKMMVLENIKTAEYKKTNMPAGRKTDFLLKRSVMPVPNRISITDFIRTLIGCESRKGVKEFINGAAEVFRSRWYTALFARRLCGSISPKYAIEKIYQGRQHKQVMAS